MLCVCCCGGVCCVYVVSGCLFFMRFCVCYFRVFVLACLLCVVCCVLLIAVLVVFGSCAFVLYVLHIRAGTRLL